MVLKETAMTFRAGIFASLAAAVLLTGCMGKPKDNSVPCPQTGILQDAGEITVFKPETDGEAIENVVASARLANYSGGCAYRDGKVEFVLNLDFEAVQGAEGQKLKRFDFPYFIAILSPAEEVLQRQSFSTTVPFDNKREAAAPVDPSRTQAVYLGDAGLTREEHRLRLAVDSRDAVRQHKVVVGFELTPDQLAFNRADGAE
jgi:hypothetical protein